MTDEIRESILDFATSRKHGSFLLTMPSKGFPLVIQMGGIVDRDFSVRIRTNADRLKVKQIRNNPHTAYLIVERTEEIQRNVLIQGLANISDDSAEVARFFDDLRGRFNSKLDPKDPRFATSVIITIKPSFVRAEGFPKILPPASMYTERFDS